MRQPAICLVAFSLVFCFLNTTVNAQDGALQLGTAIERKLGPNETHVFSVTLEENQFAQVVVDQRGIDVIVRVFAPGDRSLGEFDSPNGDNGPESVTFVGTAPGAYRILVSPLNLGAPVSGGYEIKLVELRQATEQELKTNKNLEVVKAKGIALFGEVEALIPELHMRHTRIRAQLQAAQILWDIDQKRSAKYMNDAMAGVKEFVATADPSTQEYTSYYSVINELRYEILRTLASRDPETALSFLYATTGSPNPYGNDREQAQQERDMELSIANQMLAKDPKRTLAIARQNLKRGYSSDLMNTISMLRQKDPEVATELANEVANKVANEKLLKNPQAGLVMAGLITMCNSSSGRMQDANSAGVAAPPLLSEQTCRDLLQKAFDEALSFQTGPNAPYTAERDAAWNLLNNLRSMGQALDANVSGGVAAVEKKWTELNNSGNPYQEKSQQIQAKLESGAVDGAIETIQKAPEELHDQLYQQLASAVAAKGDGAWARQIVNQNITNGLQRRQALASVDQQELYQQISHGKVEDALRTLAALKTPRERASMLMEIVRQIGPGQKRANAINFLEQARALLPPGVQAQDQQQMYALVELARAFSRYDVKRSFEIIDPLVDQVNDLCAAARVLDGFGLDSYDNDELIMQNGNNLANVAMSLTNVLGTLAVINFDRAKLTSDRLRLPELRLHAYLDIAEQTIQASKSESVTQRSVLE